MKQIKWKLVNKNTGKVMTKIYSTRKEAREVIASNYRFNGYAPVKVKTAVETTVPKKKPKTPTYKRETVKDPMNDLTRNEALSIFLTGLFEELAKTPRKTVGRPICNNRKIGLNH